MRFWLGLGSNLGERLETLRLAVSQLEQIGRVAARSRVFASAAVGGPPQPPFLNAAVALDSELAPEALLPALQEIEARLGRDRSSEVRWGPRTLDLDVLLAGARGEVTIARPELTVPHPRLHERAFALATLVDLDPTLIHPMIGRPLTGLYAAAHPAQPVAPTGDAL